MKHTFRRLFAFLLVVVMLCTLLPSVSFAASSKSDDLWAQIIAYEKEHLRKTRSINDTVSAADYAALSGDIAEMVMASDDYTEGTCTYNGTNVNFFWEDAEGEPQGYFPSLRAKVENGSNGTNPSAVGETVTKSYAKRGGSPSATDVYVIGPWYGSDSSFTDQYKTEGQSIASTTGGTYTLYSGNNATITNVANAIANGAVVIFDSHGVTDYDNELNYTYPDDPSSYVYDSVTQANTSYLTLTSGTGITSADKKAVTGPFGTYYHACSWQDTEGNMVYCVDGTAIANHMTKNAPNSMLWMAICLGMATDGIATPLRSKGVEVVYGYSQSVTFTGDYYYENLFWNAMKNGGTVASAAAAMKNTYSYDPAYASDTNYNTVAKARTYFVAFPVVVSDEDTYPGQRTSSNYGVDSVQTVHSTWTLLSSYTVSAVSNNTAYGTVSVSGNTITCSPKTGYYVASAQVTSGSGTCTVNGNTVTVNAASDCTVTVTFAAKSTVTVDFGGSAAAISAYAGDSITMPTFSGSVPGGYTFAGWVQNQIPTETTEKPTFYKAGDTYTPTANTTFYALYSRTEGSTGTGNWVHVTDATTLTAGTQVLIASSSKGKVAGNISNATLAAVNATFSPDGSTVTKPDGALVLTLVSAANNNWELSNADGQKLGATAVKKLAWDKGTTTWSISGNNSVTIQNATTSYGRFLYNVNSPRFTTYTSSATSSMVLPELYRLDGSGGTTYYVTNANACANHNFTEYAENNAETHLASCSVCGEIIEQPHNFTITVIGDTQTHACSLCGYTYSTTITRYNVNFSVPSGVAAVSTMQSVNGAAITLPTPNGTPTGAYSYTFLGWVAATVDNAASAPATIYAAGTDYTPTGNTTLYALYQYSVGGSSSPDYGKITTQAALTNGSYVIASAATGKALSTDVSSNWVRVGGTYSGDTISPAATDVWTYTDGVLSCDGGKLYTSGAKKISLAQDGTTWTFEFYGGKWTIKEGNNILSYNSDGGFRTYSGGYGSDKTFYLYKGGAAGTAYYTTVITASCAHEAASLQYTDNGNGTHTVTCGACSTVIHTAEAHTFSNHTCVCGASNQILKIESAAPILNGKFDIAYTAVIPEGYTNARMVFTGPSGTQTVTDYTLVNSKPVFTYTGINPQCMGDNITAALYATKNGVEETVSLGNYSVRQYCINKLADNIPVDLRILLSDMLAYGAAAQTYMSYKTNSLVTAGLSAPMYSSFASLTDLGASFTGTADANTRWASAGLTLTNSVAMRFRFYAKNTAGLTVKVAINGREQSFTQFTPVAGKADYYEISFTGISAEEFGDDVTAGFYRNNTKIGNTLSYSVNAYVCAKQNDSNTALANLVKALYNYGKSAKFYEPVNH